MQSKRRGLREIPSIHSSHPDLIEDRNTALRLIEELQKVPKSATQADIRWFWLDYEMDKPSDYKEAKDEVEQTKSFLILNESYPFKLTEWVVPWYDYVPEAIQDKLFGAGKLDWDLFFTLIEPIKNMGCSFRQLMKALNAKQTRIVREQIYQEILDTPELRDKILHDQMIPSIYTYHVPYYRIRKEVKRRLGPEFTKPPPQPVREIEDL